MCEIKCLQPWQNLKDYHGSLKGEVSIIIMSSCYAIAKNNTKLLVESDVYILNMY